MSHVYVANEVGTNLYKIGVTSNPSSRLSMLRTGSPHDIQMYACDMFEHPEYVEKTLHDKWRNNRIIREWFNLTVEELREVYKDMEKLGATHCHCSKPCRGQAPKGRCYREKYHA